MSKASSNRGTGAIQYSEAFKRLVVDQIDRGHLTMTGASRTYAIGGHMTIRRWLERYSRYRIPGTMVRMTNDEAKHPDTKHTSPKDQITAQDPVERSSAARIQKLEAALAAAERTRREDELKIQTLETLIDLAETEYRIPIRKNSGAGPSPR